MDTLGNLLALKVTPANEQDRAQVADLAAHCRGLRYYLEAGLTLAQAMKHQSKKGPASVRPVASRISDRLDQGDDLTEILPDEAVYFPPIDPTMWDAGPLLEHEDEPALRRRVYKRRGAP